VCEVLICGYEVIFYEEVIIEILVNLLNNGIFPGTVGAVDIVSEDDICGHGEVSFVYDDGQPFIVLVFKLVTNECNLGAGRVLEKF
jgi:hypothetical protein